MHINWPIFWQLACRGKGCKKCQKVASALNVWPTLAVYAFHFHRIFSWKDCGRNCLSYICVVCLYRNIWTPYHELHRLKSNWTDKLVFESQSVTSFNSWIPNALWRHLDGRALCGWIFAILVFSVVLALCCSKPLNLWAVALNYFLASIITKKIMCAALYYYKDMFVWVV